MAKYSKRKDGRYVYQFRAGYDENGKRIMKTVYGKTVPELEAKIFEAKKTEPQKKKSMTVYEYCRNYVEIYKAGKAENTKSYYNNSLKNYIAVHFDGIYMSELTRDQVQSAVNTLACKRRTASVMIELLRQACSNAVEEGIIQKNPCSKIELPAKTKVVHKRALTDEEKAAIFTADFTEKERAFVMLIYGCGLRREEALGLRLKDIAKDCSSVHVEHVCTMVGYDMIEKDVPKNDSSVRTVPVPESCKPAIQEYVNIRGNEIGSDDILIRFYGLHDWSRFWRSIKAKIGSDSLSPHIFRHNYATALYYSNISVKQAAALMGHSNTKMIMEVYAHIDEKKENVVEKLNAIL